MEPFVEDLNAVLSASKQFVVIHSNRPNTIIRRIPPYLKQAGPQYYTPNVVSIGPYHRGKPNLQEMEVMKAAAACDFMASSNHTVDEFYTKVNEVINQARSAYEDDFGHISDKEFTRLILIDACFLLQFILTISDVNNNSMWSKGVLSINISRDIILAENQLPWFVLMAMLDLKDDLKENIFKKIDEFCLATQNAPWIQQNSNNVACQPTHLLDLLREKLLGPEVEERRDAPETRFTFFQSAVDLEQIGIALQVSDGYNLRDIQFTRGNIYGLLSLPPVLIDEWHWCLLTNIGAYESCSHGNNDYGVCSFLSLLSLLISGKDDIVALRLKGIIRSTFTDQVTLDLLKAVASQLPVGPNFFYIIHSLNDYLKRRKARSCLHRAIFHNREVAVSAVTLILLVFTILQTFFTIYPLKHSN